MKRRKFTIKWSKEFKQWELWEGDDLLDNTYGTKADLVKDAAHLAKDCQPSQLVCKNKKGRIQWERTYPRSSDPRRRKG